MNQKVSESTITKRLREISQNGFALKINHKWHHSSEPLIVSQHAIEYYSDEEWDRLMDQMDQFINRD